MSRDEHGRLKPNCHHAHRRSAHRPNFHTSRSVHTRCLAHASCSLEYCGVPEAFLDHKVVVVAFVPHGILVRQGICKLGLVLITTVPRILVLEIRVGAAHSANPLHSVKQMFASRRVRASHHTCKGMIKRNMDIVQRSPCCCIWLKHA
jgi:hypothetical protein